MNFESDVAQLDLSRLVTITGAGFSKHASSSMPLLSDLGEELTRRIIGRVHERLSTNERLAIDAGAVPFGSVELWMTALAARQPYHTKSEQLRRRSLFMDVADLVAQIVSEREQRALSATDCPRWLKRFVTLLHYRCGTVLTFNYDTLIEATVSSLELRGEHNAPPIGIRAVTRTDVMRGYPPALPTRAAHWTDGSQVDSLRLIKLHGSLNWWGRPESTDLFSVVDGESVGSWGTPTTHVPPIRGLSPVIVPPVADKSGQYGNATVETLWLEAAEAIRNATCVVLFGYSMPQTDTTAAALVTENLAIDVPVVIVDPRAKKVAEQLHDWTRINPIIVGDEQLAEHEQRVDRMLDALEAAVARAPTRRYIGTTAGATHPKCYVRIDTADGSQHPVRGIEGDVVVADEPLAPGWFEIRPPEPAVDPGVLDSCRFVRLPGERVSPIYFAERTANTSEQAIVILRVGPS